MTPEGVIRRFAELGVQLTGVADDSRKVRPGDLFVALRGELGLAASLPATKFAFGWADIASGFSFNIPAGAVGIAIAVFGLTGVGADEMTTYTYWCMEKGYARWTGPDDGSEARAQAMGKVMTQRYGVPYQVVTHGAVFRVLMGPVAADQQAALLDQIRQGGLEQAFIVP